MSTTNEIVTYLGRTYTLANDLGAAIVLLDDQNGTEGGYMTVPARMVKRAAATIMDGVAS